MPDELTVSLFGKLLAALEGPISLVLLLGCLSLAWLARLFWTRWHTEVDALEERIDELVAQVATVQQGRVDDARANISVLQNTSAVLSGIERQARAALESPRPINSELGELMSLLRSRKP